MFSHKKFRILTSNDDNTVEDDDTDDYSTGATWYSLSLMIVGAAAFVGLIAYAVVGYPPCLCAFSLSLTHLYFL